MTNSPCIQEVMFCESLEKRCSKCRAIKPLGEFGSHPAYCQPCRKLYQKERYLTNRAKIINNVRRHQRKNVAECLIQAAKQRAKIKNVPFDMEGCVEEIRSIVDAGMCQLTGMPFIIQDPNKVYSPSLDRIIPAKGYVKGNVRVIIRAANLMLNNWGVETLLEIADAIRAHN